MAIIEDPQRVGVQPSNRYIREFKTDLPSPDFSGVQRISAALSGIAEEQLKTDADLKSKEFAYSQTLQKDGEGNYVKPVVPEGFGPYARNKVNELLDERMVQSTYYDIQPELDRIRNDPQNMRDPVRARELMNTYVDTRLKALPPHIAGRVSVYAMKEVEERASSVARQTAEETRSLNLQDLKTRQEMHFKNIIELLSIGNEESNKKAEYLSGEITRIQGVIVAQNGDSRTGTDNIMQTLESAKEAGRIFNDIKTRFNDGVLHSNDLRDLSRILSGGGAADENIFGVTPDGVVNNMPTPEVRKALSAKIEEFYTKTIEREQKSEKQQTYEIIRESVYNGIRVNKPIGMSDSQYAEHVLRLSQEYGINLNTPEGVSQISAKVGEIPAEYYKTLFKNNVRDGKIEELLPLYEHIRQMPDRNGAPVDRTHDLVESRDHSLMENYLLFRRMDNQQPADAMRSARKAIENGFIIGRDPAKMEAKLSRELSANGVTNPTINEFQKFVDDRMNEINPYWFQGGQKLHYKDLDSQTKANMLGLVQRKVADDVTLEAAVSYAAGALKRNYTTSPSDLGNAVARQQKEFYNGKTDNPLVRTDAVVPSIPNPLDLKSNSSEYVKRYMNELVLRGTGQDTSGTVGTLIGTGSGSNTYARSTANAPSFKLYALNDVGTERVVLPKDAEFEKNLFVRQRNSTDKSFDVFYFNPKDKGSIPRNVTYEDGRPLVVNFSKVARENTEYVNDKIKSSVSTNTPIAPKVEGTSYPDKTNIYKPVDINDILPSGGIAGSTGGGVSQPSAKPPKTPKSGDLIAPRKDANLITGKDVDQANVNIGLKTFVADLQTEFPKAIVTSGYRDDVKNTKVGGVKNSQHLHGNAIDISIAGMDENDRDELMKRIVKNPAIGGIGYYNNESLHIDYRDPSRKAAWGPNRSKTSLPMTPWWYKNNVEPWRNQNG
jgi:hypothetical protein